MSQLDQSMPNEILHKILSLSLCKDLLQARSVSRQWCAISTVYLFEHQRFDVTAEVEEGFRSVLAANHLADSVRGLEVNACRPLQRYDKAFDFQLTSTVRDALDNLYKLKHVSSLTIRFDVCPGGEYERSSAFDRYLLANVLIPLECSRSFTTRIHHLAISNVPSKNMPALTGSYWFIDFLSNLRTLKLAMQTYQPRSGRDWYPRTLAEEEISFYMTLPDTWLHPACQNLKTLYLSAEREWGWYPKVDFRHTHFPHLQNLSLRNFTLSHDWQLQWLLSHAQSLHYLRMASCAILVLAIPTPQRLESDGYPFPQTPIPAHRLELIAASKDLFSLLDIDFFHSKAENGDGPADREEELGRGLDFGASYHAYFLEEYRPYFTPVDFSDDNGKGEHWEDKMRRQYSEDKQALFELFDVIEERNTARL